MVLIALPGRQVAPIVQVPARTSMPHRAYADHRYAPLGLCLIPGGITQERPTTGVKKCCQLSRNIFLSIQVIQVIDVGETGIVRECPTKRDNLQWCLEHCFQVGGGPNSNLPTSAVADQGDGLAVAYFIPSAQQPGLYDCCDSVVVDRPVAAVGRNGDLEQVAYVNEIGQ